MRYTMEQALQRYAVSLKTGWCVLEASIPCRAGQGKIIAFGLSEYEMTELLRQGKKKYAQELEDPATS